MNPRFPNRPCDQAQYQISRKFLVCNLFLGLMGTACAATITPVPTPEVSQVPSPVPTDPVVQKLVGTWRARTDAVSGEYMTIVFTPKGKLLQMQEFFLGTMATSFDYTVNSNSNPLQLDLKSPTANSKPVRTMFEFTAHGGLRLKLLRVFPVSGQDSPGRFELQTLTFNKESDKTTLLPDAKERNLDPVAQPQSLEESAEAAQAEVLAYPFILGAAQQAYYLENGTFAKTIDQLGIGIKSETANYRYQVEPPGNRTEQVKIVAQAKRSGLHSITVVVFKTKPKTVDYDVLLVTACWTEQPSLIAPEMPKINPEIRTIVCPPGSQQY